MSLMKVEKVPDSTFDMIGGLDQQVKVGGRRCKLDPSLKGLKAPSGFKC